MSKSPVRPLAVACACAVACVAALFLFRAGTVTDLIVYRFVTGYGLASLATPLVAGLGAAAAIVALHRKRNPLAWISLALCGVALLLSAAGVALEIGMAWPLLTGSHSARGLAAGADITLRNGDRIRVPAGWGADVNPDGMCSLFSGVSVDGLPGNPEADMTILVARPGFTEAGIRRLLTSTSAPGRTVLSLPISRDSSLTAAVWHSSRGATVPPADGVSVETLVQTVGRRPAWIDAWFDDTSLPDSARASDAALVRWVLRVVRLSVHD